MTLPAVAVVDSGPLYAAADRAEPDHQRSIAALMTPGLRLFVPAMVVAEVCYLLGTRLGPDVEALFLEELPKLTVVAPDPDEWPRIAELVRQYRNLPLGGTDAAAIVLAERLSTDLVITLDRRHFGIVRPRHCPAFRLLPDLV